MSKKAGPFRALGRFNSTRSPDIIYTVKEHLDVRKDSDKRISCDCPGWRFSVGRLGHHECKHTRHVAQDTKSNLTQFAEASEAFRKTEIGHALRRRKDSAKRRLAAACQEAGVQLSDPAFRALLVALKPYLRGEPVVSSTPTSDDVLRVITLD